MRADSHGIEINDQFAKALELMNGGEKNLFVTGRAGTGKSTLLTYFRETTKRQVVVLAPTGVAAVNVKGQTIHSFFGFKPDITVEKARRVAKKVLSLNEAGVYQKIETLVIDEISMVRADVFDCVDAFLRIARKRGGAAFGGARLVMIGDLYQLPPVVPSRERDIFSHHYTSPFFFDSRSFASLGVEFLELEKIYRQHDDKFISLLNAIRNNTIDGAGIVALNKRFANGNSPKENEGYIHLTALNRDADVVNEKRLVALHGKSREFVANVTGKFDERSYPADSVVKLKIAAQVMLLNNDPYGRWVNGTIGMVVGMGKESVRVKLQSGETEDVEPFTWNLFRFDVNEKTKRIVSESVGKFTQIPLMLAWALTIHKSQGKTFDRAIIDVGRAFAAGQVYVALSRLRTLDGMMLFQPLKKNHVRVDWRVVKFMTGHSYAVSEKEMPLGEKISLIESAIKSGQRLAITYLKSSDVKSKRIVEPVEVGEMEYKGKPFTGLRCICNLRGEERVFSVRRILEMEIADQTKGGADVF